MTPAGLEPAIPSCDQPQTKALDGAAIMIGNMFHIGGKNSFNNNILTLNSATFSL